MLMELESHYVYVRPAVIELQELDKKSHISILPSLDT